MRNDATAETTRQYKSFRVPFNSINFDSFTIADIHSTTIDVVRKRGEKLEIGWKEENNR